MDTLPGLTESPRSPAAITARVLADAKRAYGHLADEDVVERCAREAVEEILSDAVKVTTFVPVLAMRRVRDLIEVSRAQPPR